MLKPMDVRNGFVWVVMSSTTAWTDSEWLHISTFRSKEVAYKFVKHEKAKAKNKNRTYAIVKFIDKIE